MGRVVRRLRCIACRRSRREHCATKAESMPLQVGIVSDEISRDFREALRVGMPLGLRRYEIRNLAAGRAPVCGDAAMRETERIAREEGVEITALSPGLFKNTHAAVDVPPRDGRSLSARGGVGAALETPRADRLRLPQARRDRSQRRRISRAIHRPRRSSSGWRRRARGRRGRRPHADDRARAHLLVRQRARHGVADRARGQRQHSKSITIRAMWRGWRIAIRWTSSRPWRPRSPTCISRICGRWRAARASRSGCRPARA